LAEVGDLVAVLSARVDAHVQLKADARESLGIAIEKARAELVFLHQQRRKVLLDEAIVALETLFDREALAHSKFRIYRAADLSDCTKPVAASILP
jgi:hypothetical protein